MAASLAALVLAAPAHAAATIMAQATPVNVQEQTEYQTTFIGGCAQGPPPVFDHCTAPQGQCNVFPLDVATFSSSRSGAAAADFTASVAFDDGYTATALVDSLAPPNSYSVSAPHPAFADPASEAVHVTIIDKVDGSSASVATPVTITELQVRAVGCDSRSVPAGAPFSDLHLATVLDSEQGTGDLGARIDWGDGTTSLGTVETTGSYPDFVAGSHTFARPGTYNVSVTVSESDDPASTNTVSAVVTAAAVATVSVPATGAGGTAPLGAALAVAGLLLVALAVCIRVIRLATGHR